MTQWIITSSVLVLIIAVLRFALRGKISLKLQYALWGLVLVRLMFPFSVLESPASVLNLVREREEETENLPYYEAYAPETANPPTFEEDIFILDDDIEHIKPDTNIVVDDNGYVTEPEIKVISTDDVLKGTWLSGAAVSGVVFAVSNLRFRKKLKNSREYVRGTKAWLPVYESSAVKTPCLFGAVKPTIYVTKEVLADEKVFSHVLEHETTHYRHGDHVWSVLRCFCLAIHWYNPLVWLAAFLSMRDSELACDEDTIKRIGEEERIEYGRTLINLTCEKPAAGILSAATTMTGSKSSIKERIMLIAKKPKMLKITAVLVAVIAVFAVGCTFTGAVVYNPKTAAVEVAESFSNRLEPELTGLDGVIRMTVTAASPEEITTKIYNKSSEEICYSTGYALHFEKDGKWYELKKIKETTDTIFSEVQTKFVSAEYESFWTNVSKESFGKLPDGKYRIIRTVSFGEMDVSENEFYVIAAEFILADGNFVDAGPIINETEFAVSELIYRHSASSVLGFSPIRYEIPEWKWEEFPYTDEEWKNLFFASDAFPFPDISQYEERYYQRLDSLSFIAYLDGELWSVYLSPKKSETPDDLWVWDVYRIVPEEENTEENKALWEFAPALSSGTPWFRFEFDFDFTFINAGVYAGEGQGSLYDIDSSENSDALEIKNGDAIRWVPTVDGISGVPSATLNFAVYQNGNPEKHTHTGRIEIKRISSENGKTLYEATLVSETLSLKQNMEFGGGIISIKPEEIPFPETERLMEILWNSDSPYKEIAENGYTFYGAEEQACLGYENLFSFALKFPENKSESFYIASSDTTWVLSEIFYSKDQKSWIYTEYWIDIFNGNERNEKSFEISEIKAYADRVSIYFRNGSKRVIYRYGSVQGLPINNCSHPEQAHYIDYGIIKFINSEEFRAEYEKTHSEPYLDFDAFTNTLYEEEEKCLVNIYHYIEYYGLSYDDFIAVYGTEEYIAEIWGEADIKGYYEYRESGTPLTADEIRRVSEAFEAFRLENGVAHVNLAANFLQGEFNKPEEINAAAFLYYFPSGMLITDEAEFEDLKKTWASYGYTVPEGTTIEDYPVPLHKIPKSMVDEALEKYLGIGLEKLRNSDLDSLAEGGIYYMEKYDCFYSTASDAHAARFVCESGEIFPDGMVVLYGEGGTMLILKKHPDGSYKIYSYHW